MNRTVTMIIMFSTTLVCSNAFAIKQLVYLSPNATTFRVESQKGGMMRFTIVRNPADARKPLNKSLILVRSANLSVSDTRRTLLTAPIAPRVNKDGKLIYEFSVSKEHAPHSVFTLSEIDGTRARAIAQLGWTPELVFRRQALLGVVLRIRQVFCIRGSDKFSWSCRTFRCTGRR